MASLLKQDMIKLLENIISSPESDETDGSVKGIFQFQNVRYELMGNVSETEMENAITSFRIKYIQ